MTFSPIKICFLLLGLLAAFTGSARAQWRDITYTIRPGWNAIWLPGDATWGTVEAVLNTATVTSLSDVWLWNPNARPFQFTTDPASPAEGTPEWLYWKRSDAAASTLRQLIGQRAYLVRSTAAANITLSIKQRILSPNVVWQRTGANLLGFPARADVTPKPTFATYFASYPPAIAAGTRVFKYVGGELTTNVNPFRIVNPTTEILDPTQAYWFDTQTVSDFDAPIEVSTSTGAGFDFGASQETVTLQLRNRTNAPITITIVESASATAPPGQPEVVGRVPLGLPTRKAGGPEVVTPFTGSTLTRTIPAQSSDLVRVSVDRLNMKRGTGTAGIPGDTFGSLLRITDSTNLVDILLPVSAQVRSNAGLWVGDASVNLVESKVAGSPGKSVAAPFPLRLIMHVNSSGQVALLQQVFSGLLKATPNITGLCTAESLLESKDKAKAGASRFMAAHLPLNFAEVSPNTVFNLGASPTVTWKVKIPFDDQSSPFVHQYHPDHDNLDARFQKPLPDGIVDNNKAESWTVDRSISLSFAATAPAGVSPTSYGSTVLAGTYREAITGLRRNGAPAAESAHNVEGTFILRRVSDTATFSKP